MSVETTEITKAIVSFVEEHGVKRSSWRTASSDAPTRKGSIIPRDRSARSVGSGPRANDGPAMSGINLNRQQLAKRFALRTDQKLKSTSLCSLCDGELYE